MQIVAWVIALTAYLDIGALAWTVAGMDKCQAQEGCLFYIGYFWIAAIVGASILLVGSTVYVVARTRVDRSLPIALCALLAFSTYLAIFMAAHTPA